MTADDNPPPRTDQSTPPPTEPPEPVWQNAFESGLTYGILMVLGEMVLYIIGAGAFGGWPFGPIFTLIGAVALLWVLGKALVETNRAHFERLEREARERDQRD